MMGRLVNNPMNAPRSTPTTTARPGNQCWRPSKWFGDEPSGERGIERNVHGTVLFDRELGSAGANAQHTQTNYITVAGDCGFACGALKLLGRHAREHHFSQLHTSGRCGRDLIRLRSTPERNDAEGATFDERLHQRGPHRTGGAEDEGST